MLVLKETTPSFHPNICHVYITSNDKGQLFGYIPIGQTKPISFKTPKQFTHRDRTFKVLKRTLD